MEYVRKEFSGTKRKENMKKAAKAKAWHEKTRSVRILRGLKYTEKENEKESL